MMELQYYNESFIHVACDYDDGMNIGEAFSFYAPNYHFVPSYKSGFWDGKIKLFDLNTQLFPYGLAPKLIKWLEINDYDYTTDNRIFEPGENITVENLIDFAKNNLKSGLVPRDFQIDAVRYFIRYKKMIGLSATASGKSYIYYLFINFLKAMYKDMRYLMLVPRTSLVEQMAGDFRDYASGWCEYDKYVHKIYSGKEKYTDKMITISTWQSLQNMPPDYFNKFNCLIVDEVHEGKAKEISRIIKNSINAVYRIGMTGHLQDSKIDRLQLEGLFGRFKTFSKSAELIEKGILSDIKIKCYVLKHNKNTCTQYKINRNEHNAIKKDKNTKVKVNELYIKEIELVKEQKHRKKFVVQLAGSRKKNTMVLFKGIEYGKELCKLAKANIKGKRIYYVDGSVKTSIREKIRAMAEKYNNVLIFASFGTFSTGINIKNLHNLIFAESMLSSVKVIQSIGRVLRKQFEKNAVLFDIVDDLRIDKRSKNYTLKHFFHRIKYYDKEGFDYNVKEVKL